MRGVIMETKNGRAVLLTTGGEFVNIKNKGYSIGDKVNITSNTSRLCAMAASLVIVCAGIGSYFMPAGYVSVDINPSLMMTLNMYNRVIDVESFNDDARILLNKTDIKGKSAEESVEMLIKASEEIGYINDNNRDVILDVVPGIRKPNMAGIKHKNIEITSEMADRETLRIAQNIGVSIAKAKAIEEYTTRNGGDMRSNAAKFNDKSVKEIRNIMSDNGNLPYKKPTDAPKPQERKSENISEPPKPQENYKQPYNINNNPFPISEPKREENILPVNQSTQNLRPPENTAIQISDKPQEFPPELNEPPRWDITQANPALQIEPELQGNVPVQDNNISQIKPQQTGEPVQEKPPVNSDTIHMEQNPQNNVSNQGDSKPQNGTSKPSEPAREDNKPSDDTQQTTEQKPQSSIQNQGDKNLPDKPTQSDGQSPNITIPSDNQPSTEQKPNITEGKPQDKPAEPVEPEREPGTEQGNQPSQSDNNTYKPQPSEPKQENNTPPKAESKPQENAPMQNNNAPQTNEQPPSEPKREDSSPQNKQPPQSEPKPQNDGGHNMANEGIGAHNENREMP